MKNYPKYVKTTLNHIIHDMGKHPEDFCVDPERNFTRNRKLHFEDILSLLVKMGGKSLHNEILNTFGYTTNTATVSAFVQQRVKIKPEALAHLFHKFTDTCSRPNLYKGYQLLTQEIFARLTMYNFCELITSHAVIQNKNRKLTYQVNFSAAVHICRKFLRGSVAPPNVEALIKKEVVPIRPGRSTPRKAKSIKFKGFLYRIA